MSMVGPAGTFFNPVPEENENEDNDNDNAADDDDDIDIKASASAAKEDDIDDNGLPMTTFPDLLSININTLTPPNAQPFVGIGPPLNDPKNPEYDKDGYTLYADERTGKRSRVFEALVEYPTRFVMKIVGRDKDDTPQEKGRFVTDIVDTVAQNCQVAVSDVEHSVRVSGKWTSVTVKAPVQNAQMLYDLYEVIDQDPRVKFKF